MQLQPKPADYPRIRKAIRFYKVTSIITGVMLMLLLTEMILKYSPIHLELFVGGGEGLQLAPVVASEGCQWYSMFFPGQDVCELSSTGAGANISLMILIAHGWFYVAYLVSCFMVWSPMRWRFTRFLLLALGGVIPLMSFFLEVRVTREVTAFLDDREAAAAAAGSAAVASPQTSATSSAAEAAPTLEGNS